MATGNKHKKFGKVRPHMQDGGQQEVKDTDVWNCRWNE